MKTPVRRSLLLLVSLGALIVLVLGALRLAPPDLLGWRFLNAASDGSIPKVRLLLFLGADINYASGGGTALHGAAARGDIALMEFLLSRGAHADKRVKWEMTPLYYARIYNRPDAERLLLLHGADPDTSRINPP